MQQAKKIYFASLDVLWAAALVALPFTSFPLLVKLTGAIVAPLSAIPVALLCLLGLIPYLLNRGALPKESLPLVVFVLVALATSAAAFFIAVPSFRGMTIGDQELRAFVTIAVGISFYFLFAAWPGNPVRCRRTLQWISVGGILMLAWALLQAVFIFLGYNQYPHLMMRIQRLFLVQSPFFSAYINRVTGFAYEASWFAHQMVILYLPLWFAASYLRTSAFSIRFWRISLENILLILGIILFFLCSPRVGLLSFLLIVVFLFTKINLAMYKRLSTKILASRLHGAQDTNLAVRFLIGAGTSLLFLAAYGLTFGVIFYLATQRDWRLALLLRNKISPAEISLALSLNEGTIIAIGSKLAFLERIAYWFTGWKIFNQYPWLGVGLGNSGFFFLDKMPALGFSSYEIRNVLFYHSQMPNIKSFWVRLLAETGLVGFSVFVSWLVVLWRSTHLTARSRAPLFQMMALAGQLGLIAFIGEGFSIDSFAMPYLWVLAGLISAGGMVYRRAVTTIQVEDEHNPGEDTSKE